MIAIPSRTRNGVLLLTTIFGRTEQIALADSDDNIEVKDNPFDSGADLAAWLIEQKVNTVVIRNMGSRPYQILQKAGVKVFATTKNRAPISEIVEDLRNGRLTAVTQANRSTYLRTGHHRHSRAS
jgi:predicted Fe-Mo cluster-binding NifX family protein